MMIDANAAGHNTTRKRLEKFQALLLLDMYYYGIHILQPSITSTEHEGPKSKEIQSSKLYIFKKD